MKIVWKVGGSGVKKGVLLEKKKEKSGGGVLRFPICDTFLF